MPRLTLHGDRLRQHGARVNIHADSYPPAGYSFGNGLRLVGANHRARLALSGAITDFTLLTWIYPQGSTITLENSGSWLMSNRLTTTGGWSFRVIQTGGGTGIAFRVILPNNQTGPEATIADTTNYFNRRLLLALRYKRTGMATNTAELAVSLNGAAFSAYIANTIAHAAMETWQAWNPAATNLNATGQLIGFNALGNGGFPDTIFGEQDMVSGLLTNADVAAIWNFGYGSAYRDTTLAATPSIFRFKNEAIVSGQIADEGGGNPMYLFNSPTLVAFP